MASKSASTGVCLLESRYLDLCREREVQPDLHVLSALEKAKVQESRQELCVLDVALDQIASYHLHVLTDALEATDSSGIDAVDVHQLSRSSIPDEKHVLPLLRTVNEKLRVVDIRQWSFLKDVLCDISRRGLACCFLSLLFAPIVKLNFEGNFLRLHTLSLDFCVSLSRFRIDCFSCMPNLMRLSMCGTRISNLWMAISALSKLPSLVELRFQNCICCPDTGACRTLFGNNRVSPSGCQSISSVQPLPLGRDNFLNLDFDRSFLRSQVPNYRIFDRQSFASFLSDQSNFWADFIPLLSEVDFSNFQLNMHRLSEISIRDDSEVDRDSDMEISANQVSVPVSGCADSPVPFLLPQVAPDSGFREKNNPMDSRHIDNTTDGIFDDNSTSLICDGDHDLSSWDQFDEEILCVESVDTPRWQSRTLHCHPSPICYETHYREYMIASLPQLNVLDNILILSTEREKANENFKQHFELLPYQRPLRESITAVLRSRELGFHETYKRSHLKKNYSARENNHFFMRSLSSAKLHSSPWPHMHSISKFNIIASDEMKAFRPRQFEYHPSNPAMMVFGTLDGELVVLNHESGNPVGYIPKSGAFNSILGLCWLQKHPSKFIAGSDNGSIMLYDVCQMSPLLSDSCYNLYPTSCSFDEFAHLTSIHINSTDELFLASGFSKHVALYDIGTGKQLQLLKDLHLEHINVVKFSNHSPSLFATASFDQDVKMWDIRQGCSCPCYTVSSSRGNVMVCFSPDDHYLLSSAVDNEVRQHLAVDGRLHMVFDISSTGSPQNYTRSYYMNGRDYIISGSSEENIVRVCCSQTGRRLRDIFMESNRPGNSTFVQSLRGDPFRVFHMSVLTSHSRPNSMSEIIRVNMLACGDEDIEDDIHVHSDKVMELGGAALNLKVFSPSVK